MAVLLVYVFSIQLGWFPAVGYDRITGPGGLGEPTCARWRCPSPSSSPGLTAVYTRVLRSDLIATLQEDFILMARSKGLPTWHLLVRHALRPSSFSLLTVFGINFGALIGGSVIVEYFFSIPGHRAAGHRVDQQARLPRRPGRGAGGRGRLRASSTSPSTSSTPCSTRGCARRRPDDGHHPSRRRHRSRSPPARGRRRRLGVAGTLCAAWLLLVAAGSLLAPWLPLDDPA